jgi:2-oxoacid:acceptor oxidoreductase gamma subunit (pyruvate/2-ketoisovalerate family)
MHEVRFHGRGGQGAVTSAELLAQAAIAEGKYAQAFPSFGPERRGAPVIAFARVSDDPIRLRTAIQKPTLVLVLDPSLLRLVKIDSGLEAGGTLVINSRHDPASLRREFGLTARLAVVDANHIAREEIGRVITNTTMLGAAMTAVPMVPTDRLEKALEARFGRIAEKNINAFRRAATECVVSEAV